MEQLELRDVSRLAGEVLDEVEVAVVGKRMALTLVLVVMMQTAAVSHAFRDPGGGEANVDRDFLGLGAANILAGLAGTFPVNASPPRTAVVVGTVGAYIVGSTTPTLVKSLEIGMTQNQPESLRAISRMSSGRLPGRRGTFR